MDSYDTHHVHIEPKAGLTLGFKELKQYANLIPLFTKRTFATSYTQTVLGPLWLIINPLLTSIMHVVLFGNIAKLSTGGVPQLLFYFTGNAMWGYFSSCLSNTSTTFSSNAALFGKVYFPRLTMPVSNVLSQAIKFAIQMLFVVILLIFYVVRGSVAPNWAALLLIPLILIWLGLMGMGIGLLITSATTKYKDLAVLVSFGLQLWMYATPVVYPLSTVSGGLRKVILANPVTAPMELYRYAIVGSGTILPGGIIYSLVFTAAVALLGIAVFNKVERTFTDTI